MRETCNKLWPHRLGKLRLSLILCLGLLCYGRLVQAATLNVPGSYPTIQAGIDTAVDGDVVLVDDGIYTETINFNGKAVTVQSVNGPQNTIIDGNRNGSVVTFASGEGSGSVLDGFSITNGSGTVDESNTIPRTYGSGIYCNASSPTISNCIISGNSTSAPFGWGGGGGIFCGNFSSPTITNCNINSNKVAWGGGIYCEQSSSPIITNCTISDNTVQYYGGGIYCDASSPMIRNCTISNNLATDTWSEGGGIWCTASSLTITNCTISSNSATGENSRGGGIRCSSSSSPTIMGCIITKNSAHDGGGISCSYSSPTVVNSTICGNSATSHGGGIHCWKSLPRITNCNVIGNSATGTYGRGGGLYCDDSSPTITNCTISDNTANNAGAGISCIDSSSPVVINSILWGDIAGGSYNEVYLADWASFITISHSNIDPSLITGTGASFLSDNINADPLFVDPSNADYHLTASSPCIDVGDPTSIPPDFPAYDIDGDLRPQCSVYDMGTDEYVGDSDCYDISLTVGWNLISLPQQPADTAIESVLSSISGKYESVWAFQDNTWKVYDPASPGFSDLITMEAGWGYWIKMTEEANFSVSGSTPSNTIPLVSGWNLVGYNSTDPQPIADAVASIDGNYVSVWAFMEGSWKVYDPANPGFSDLLTTEPNYGYWINTTQACTWSLP